METQIHRRVHGLFELADHPWRNEQRRAVSQCSHVSRICQISGTLKVDYGIITVQCHLQQFLTGSLSVFISIKLSV